MADGNLLTHTKPSLTPLLRQLLKSKQRMGRWPQIGMLTRSQISRYLDAVEVWKKPAPRDEIIARIAALMQHYYAPATYQSVGREQFLDWGDLMQEIPGFAFHAACREWIAMQDKRPTPAAIIKLGTKVAGADLADYAALKEAYVNAPDLGGMEPNIDLQGNRKDGDGTLRPCDHTGDPFYEKFMNRRYRKDVWPENSNPERITP